MLRNLLVSWTLAIPSVLMTTIGGCPMPGAPAEDPNKVHAFKFDEATKEYVIGDKRVSEAEAKRDLAGTICSTCHVDQLSEVKSSIHYQWASKNPNVLFPGGGAHGMLDRACGLPATTGLINYTNDVQLDECAKCHTGRYLPVMEGAFTQMFSQMKLPDPAGQAKRITDAGVDCLICHAGTYSDAPEGAAIVARHASKDGVSPAASGFARSARDDSDFDGDGTPDPMIDSDGDGKPDMPMMMDVNGDGTPDMGWPTVAQDRSLAAMKSIGATNDEKCLRCHEHARTGYKRGTLFRPGHDVHSNSAKLAEVGGGEGRHCVACHTSSHHKFKRGDRVGGDLMASDYPVGSAENQLSCIDCHPRNELSEVTHTAWHTDHISCETCHIPYAAGITYSLFGQGGQVAFGRNASGRDTKVITMDHMVSDGTDADANADFEAYRTFPTLMWFDGRVSFLAQPLAVPQHTEGAKITPFKPMANGMVFDGRFFDGAMVANSAMGGLYQYNAHAMYRFFANGNNAEVFKALGMLDLSPDELRSITLMDFMSPDPNRQALAMMQVFPNMVYFDKRVFGYEHYLIGSDKPWDKNGDGMVDASQPFFFDMYSAANAGLRDFQGFNAPMGLPASYQWYPAFTDPSQTISMKVPDGAEVRMYLTILGMQLPAEEQTSYMNALKNYPAYSNGITLGGHGVKPKNEALGANNTCSACHAAGGVMDHLIPVTNTLPRAIPNFGTFEFPVYRWHFYNLHNLIDLGVNTSDKDVASGAANVDVAGNPEYIRESSLKILVNYIDPAGENSYRRADDASVLTGTSLTAKDLTWQNGEWLPVLEPDVRYVPNYEVLGYTRGRMLFMSR